MAVAVRLVVAKCKIIAVLRWGSGLVQGLGLGLVQGLGLVKGLGLGLGLNLALSVARLARRCRRLERRLHTLHIGSNASAASVLYVEFELGLGLLL